MKTGRRRTRRSEPTRSYPSDATGQLSNTIAVRSPENRVIPYSMTVPDRSSLIELVTISGRVRGISSFTFFEAFAETVAPIIERLRDT